MRNVRCCWGFKADFYFRFTTWTRFERPLWDVCKFTDGLWFRGLPLLQDCWSPGRAPVLTPLAWTIYLLFSSERSSRKELGGWLQRYKQLPPPSLCLAAGGSAVMKSISQTCNMPNFQPNEVETKCLGVRYSVFSQQNQSFPMIILERIRIRPTVGW